MSQFQNEDSEIQLLESAPNARTWSNPAFGVDIEAMQDLRAIVANELRKSRAFSLVNTNVTAFFTMAGANVGMLALLISNSNADTIQDFFTENYPLLYSMLVTSSFYFMASQQARQMDQRMDQQVERMDQRDLRMISRMDLQQERATQRDQRLALQFNQQNERITNQFKSMQRTLANQEKDGTVGEFVNRVDTALARLSGLVKLFETVAEKARTAEEEALNRDPATKEPPNRDPEV